MIRRFGATERLLHWVHATGFLAMLATGLILYLPALSEIVARRNLVKNVHIFTAVGWAVAIVLVVALGDRSGSRPTGGRSSRSTATTAAGSAGAPRRRAGSTGQKVNVILTAAFAVLFAVSGFFLWLGERDHRFLLDGTGTVHDTLMFVSVGILVGHLYLAVIHPRTRHSLRGMTLGDVREDWAREHHAKWVADVERQA